MPLFLSRQPIFDADENLVAYALSCDDDAGRPADDVEASLTAERLILDACLTQGLDQVAEGRPAFLPVSRAVLVRGAVRVVHPRRAVLSLDQGTVADLELVRACEALAADGYKFAIHATDAIGTPALWRTAHIVRLDATELDMGSLARVADLLRRHGAHLLAERVPNRVARDACFAAGVELFHGYRLARPEILPRRDVGIDHIQAFRLMKAIRDPEQSDVAIEDAFRRDLALTYKLLRLVNSAAMGGRGIHTIGHAVRLLGRDTLYRWLSLLLVSAVAERGLQLETAHLSLARARFCEQVAGACGIRAAGGPLFMVGLFSMLDTLLGVDMADLVARLELAPDVAAALTAREDFYGATLALIESYEAGDWTGVLARCADVGIDPDALQPLYVDAIQWARGQLSETLTRETSNRVLRRVSSTAKALPI
jgi:EAL and modified HD-GYP domain-containing signal transduction protein